MKANDVIILNGCVPYDGLNGSKYIFEIRAVDKTENKENVGRDLEATWYNECIKFY